jgi:hypothetical protein
LLGNYASDGLLRDQLIVLEICREYGWTYQEYMTQPHWFTELAIEKKSIENMRAKRARDAVQ